MKLEGIKFDKGKIPYYTVIFKQFPLAIRAIANRSLEGHKKYEQPGEWDNFRKLNQAGDNENRYLNAAIRHLFEEGEDTIIQHKIAVVWNLLADLQIYLEKNES